MDDNKIKPKKKQVKRRKKPKPRADGGPGFTIKRQTKKQKEEIAALAAGVFTDQEDPVEQQTETTIEQQVEEAKPKRGRPAKPKPIKQETTYQNSADDETETGPPQRVVFHQGLSQATAFLIQKSSSREIGAILNRHFGRADFDFFIHSENTYTLPYKGRRKKYKCILVEDKNGFRYSIWFDLSLLSSLGY